MSTTPEPKEPRVTWLSDVVIDPDEQAKYENAYRRGVNQALTFASDLADEAADLKEARRLLMRASSIAGKLRCQKKYKGRPPLLNLLREKLDRGTRKGGQR
jgi:hypothetical protein